MITQGKFEAGQRVRIIWMETYGGATVEGVVRPFRPGERDEQLCVEIAGNWFGPLTRFDALTGVFVQIVAPPRPVEPTGLGAVVEDADGCLWVRVDDTHAQPWREVLKYDHEDDACRRGWSGIRYVARVLSEGWSE